MDHCRHRFIWDLNVEKFPPPYWRYVLWWKYIWIISTTRQQRQVWIFASLQIIFWLFVDEHYFNRQLSCRDSPWCIFPAGKGRGRSLYELCRSSPLWGQALLSVRMSPWWSSSLLLSSPSSCFCRFSPLEDRTTKGFKKFKGKITKVTLWVGVTSLLCSRLFILNEDTLLSTYSSQNQLHLCELCCFSSTYLWPGSLLVLLLRFKDVSLSIQYHGSQQNFNSYFWSISN